MIKIKSIIIIQIIVFFTSSVFSVENSQNYILGAGDIIKINIKNFGLLSKKYTINNFGKIKIDSIGKLSVKGLTLKQLINILKIKYNKLIKSPEITIDLIESNKLKEQRNTEKFLNLIEIIKSSFYNRDYKLSLAYTEKLSDLIRKTNSTNPLIRQNKKKIDLQITEHNCNFHNKNGYYFYTLNGKIKNYVNEAFNWVKLSLKFYDRYNKLIDLKEIYAINQTPIYQYQEIPFTNKGILPKEVSFYEIKIIDYLFFNEDKEKKEYDTKKK